MNNDISNLQAILNQLYNDMLPLSGQLIGMAQVLAGFLALWYIGIRVWGHIARAEPVDIYPLLRPFVLGFAIVVYPSLMALINGVMQPTVTATSAMVQQTNDAIATLIQERQSDQQNPDAQPYVGGDGGDQDQWYQYTHPEGDDTDPGDGTNALADDLSFQLSKTTLNVRSLLQQGMVSILEWIFEAAALIISIIRTFILIVLTIMGPLVLGLSVFDGFRYSFQHWLSRYINVYLWLPVANIFGSIIAKVQALMLNQDTAHTFASGTGATYLIFLLMGIAGYACVPGTANYIVQSVGGHSLLSRINTTVSVASHLL